MSNRKCDKCMVVADPDQSFCSRCGEPLSQQMDSVVEDFRKFCSGLWMDRFINPKERKEFHDAPGLSSETKFKIAGDCGIPRFMLQINPAENLFTLERETTQKIFEGAALKLRLSLKAFIDHALVVGSLKHLHFKVEKLHEGDYELVSRMDLSITAEDIDNEFHSHWLIKDEMWSCQKPLHQPGEHHLRVRVEWEFERGKFAFLSDETFMITVETRDKSATNNFFHASEGGVNSVSNQGSVFESSSILSRWETIRFKANRDGNKSWQTPPGFIVRGQPQSMKQFGVRSASGPNIRHVVFQGSQLTMGGAWEEGLRTSIPLAPFKANAQLIEFVNYPGEFISRRQLMWRVASDGLFLKNVGLAIVEVNGIRLARDQETKMELKIGKFNLCVKKDTSSQIAPLQKFNLEVNVLPYENSRAIETVLPVMRPEVADAKSAGIRCVVFRREDGLKEVEKYVWICGYATAGNSKEHDIFCVTDGEVHFLEQGPALVCRNGTNWVADGLTLEGSVGAWTLDTGAVTVSGSRSSLGDEIS